MATNSLNPFYIEPSNGESGWQYDTDDLDELLEHDSAPATYHSPRSRSSSSRRGRLPVPNLAYDDDIANIRYRRRLRLALLSLIAFVIAWTVISQKSKSTNVVDKPAGGRFDDDDEQDDDRPSQTHHQPPVSKVQAIVTLGERNSGLSWLTTKLKECYPDLSVKSGLSRDGTWFQDDDESTDSSNVTTLVVSVFDNPYDWVEQMRLHPQYAPSHASITSWDSFVTKPWTLDNYQQTAAATEAQQCQLGFTPDRVVPCKADEFPKPAVYELNPSDGSVFASIVDLRAAKIRHFVQDVSQFQHVLGVVTVQYERLVADALDAQHKHSGLPGLLTTLNEIKKQSGDALEFECDIVSDKSLFAKPVGNHKNLRQPYVEWMNAHVDWDAEALVGYNKWDTVPPSQVGWTESNPEGLAEDDDGFAQDDDDQTKNGGRDITDTAAPTASPSAVPTDSGSENTEPQTVVPSSAEQESTDPPTATPSVAGDTNTEPAESTTSPSASPSAATESRSEQPSVAPTGMSASTSEKPTAVEQDQDMPSSSPSSMQPATDRSPTTAPTATTTEPADSSQTPAPTASPSTTTSAAPTTNENNVRRRR